MAETPRTIEVSVVPVTPPPSKVSAKVWASTIGAFIASLALAVLTALLNDPASLQQFLDAVPAWLRFIIVAALPTAITFVAGYVKRDTTREVGAMVQNNLRAGNGQDAGPYEGEHRAEPGAVTDAV